MTPLRARRRTLGLDERLAALREAVVVAEGRLDERLVAEATEVHERAGRRLGLGSELTVVALAGATGSGKSSLFNALAGIELADVGVRRPTTAVAQACVWGEDSADDLLEWLGVPRRHRFAEADPRFDGMVLLDLPDHDSIELAHRLEVDRLVRLVDLFVWVVDPQKYADAALHHRYLRPLAGYSSVMVMALNQADRLDPVAQTKLIDDLGALLEDDGLQGVPVLAISAASGQGLDDLEAVLAERVAQRRAAAERLAADVETVVASLDPYCRPDAGKRRLTNADRAALTDALAAAAGVDVVAEAVRKAHRREAGLATGWPFTRWLRRLRPNPLARLHLGSANPESGRTSIPAATPVQKARVETALRRIAESVSAGLPEPWPSRAREVSAATPATVLPELDRAVAEANVTDGRRPLWWGVVRGLQTLLAVAAGIGFLWLGVLFALEWLQIPRPPLPQVRRIPVPTVLLVGGLLAGLLVAAVSGQLARVGAQRRRRAAEAKMRERINAVAEEGVIRPLEAEMAAHDQLCRALERAAG